MGQQVANALAALRELGTPDEIRALAVDRFGPATPPRVNAHIHLPPNFSAFESVQQAVSLAEAQSIGVLGVSNYYDYEVYGDFVQRACASGIFPLFGLEIICMQSDLRSRGVQVNDPGNPGKTYLCGKGITRFDQMTAEAARLIEVIRQNDSARMGSMIDAVREIFNACGLETAIDAEAVLEKIVLRHGSPRKTVTLQERHISQAFQEALFEQGAPECRIERFNAILGTETKAKDAGDYVTMQNDIRSCLMKAGKPAFVEEAFVSFSEAHRLVLELGGIPCYPTLADGASPVCSYEDNIDELINKIRANKVYAAELIPIRNQVSVTRQYVTKMRKAGLVVTAGTEHNTLDLIPMEPFCKDGDVPEEVRSICWEGACVVAAHQFLTLHGETGFVDDQGCPNAGYASDDERIKAFAEIGAAVLQKYYGSHP